MPHMYEGILLENTIVLSPIALIIYLLLAGIAGWAIRAVYRNHWMHRQNFLYPQRHTYVEYVPEVAPIASTARAPQQLPGAFAKSSDTSFDLKVVEGIDHMIESVLNKAGILTTADLADTSASEIKDILGYSGVNLQHYDPTTWPHQAHLAYHEKWDELKRYQDFLKMH